jgi:hypothetical protein
MQNPFDVIIEKLTFLEGKFNEVGTPTANNQTPPAEIIGRAELCNRLNITEPTAIRWENKGKIPCFRIGSNVRYNWQTVLNTLEGKTKGGVNYHG